jgi:hypothetical protein
VVELLPSTQCWSVIGRALARVAAHEVAHFVDQAGAHNGTGLLRQTFDARQLASEDSYPFRWIRASR